MPTRSVSARQLLPYFAWAWLRNSTSVFASTSPELEYFGLLWLPFWSSWLRFVAIFSVRPNLVHQWTFPQYDCAGVVLRFQGEVFAAAFVLTWIFLRFVLSIRQPFRPNVLTHWRIAAIYFGVSGAGSLALLLTGSARTVVSINSAVLAAQLACFVAWIRFMRRSGEELPAFRRLSPDQVQAVEQYNRALLRAVTSLPGEVSARQAENRDTPPHRPQLR